MAKKRPDRKAQRRLEAIERQAYWDSLTTAQKLAVLATRPGAAARQIARLTA